MFLNYTKQLNTMVKMRNDYKIENEELDKCICELRDYIYECERLYKEEYIKELNKKGKKC